MFHKVFVSFDRDLRKTFSGLPVPGTRLYWCGLQGHLLVEGSPLLDFPFGRRVSNFIVPVVTASFELLT